MKEAMLVGFIEAFLLVAAIWIAIIYFANRLTLKAKPDVRFLTIALAALSVPAYIYLGTKYERYIADNSAQRFMEICAEKPVINVKVVVQQAAPVGIRVVDANHLEISRNPNLACWFVMNNTQCKRSNIGSIEWSRDDFRSAKPQFFRFSALGIQDTNGFTSQYGLYVSAREKIDPLIDKYSASIRNVGTGQILAETDFYRKSNSYCPEVDVHLADMFSQVFPVQQKLETGR